MAAFNKSTQYEVVILYAIVGLWGRGVCALLINCPHFDAGAAAPWGCGGLWWGVMHCGVGCPAARLIHLKLDETADIARRYETAASLHNSSFCWITNRQ